MILVDTSVWIDFFNHSKSKHALILSHLIKTEEEICLADIHLTEILQGIFIEKNFQEIHEYLLLFPILRPKSLQTYIQAAQLSIKCRLHGTPVLKTVDTLIAAIAIEHHVRLLHQLIINIDVCPRHRNLHTQNILHICVCVKFLFFVNV